MAVSQDNRIRSIVILGGGSAGWMTAAALSSLLNPQDVQITLVESEQIGTIGVGEATIPDIINFNRLLGIPEDVFMKATDATFKLGIEFNNWGQIGDSYFHPFGTHGADMQGIDFHQYWLMLRNAGKQEDYFDYSLCSQAARENKFTLPDNNPRSVSSQVRYAYHFDATLYARFLRKYAEDRGVIRVEGRVDDVILNGQTGHIETLELESGKMVAGEFFFDCTGFRALLLGDKLGVDYEDWTHWLPCNSAQAVACDPNGPLKPYTIATAKSAGWQWRIPTQHRTGNGHIYSDEYLSDEEARDSLLQDLDGKAHGDPKQLRFTTGCRRTFWEKNCIAIGLSAGFLEPLESTSIYLIQMGISRFISLYPDNRLAPVVQKEYNSQMGLLFDQVRDFIILHYCATERDDTPFWAYCKNMSLPESLVQKIELFREAGRIFRYEDELFSKNSWTAVLFGQGVFPKTIDPIISNLPVPDVDRSLASMRNAMQKAVMSMPTHSQFIDKYCRSTRL